MQIIEKFTASKTGKDELNEDVLLITNNSVTVLDGASRWDGARIGGMASGRWAAQTGAEGIRQMDPALDARAAFRFLTAHFQSALEKAGWKKGEPRPSAAVLHYSKTRREIWRVADSPFMVDDIENRRDIPTIAPLTEFRRLACEIALASGATMGDIIQNDPATPCWNQMILKSDAVENNENNPFGFGMLNGAPIPEKFIEVHPVPGANEIVLASDGFIRLFNTLSMTEMLLKSVQSRDPAMLREYPQVKGVKPGNEAFDDRTYVRIKP